MAISIRRLKVGARQRRGAARLTMVVVGLGLGAGGAGAAAQTSTVPPPVNDNYLASLNLNQPGTPLNRVDTLVDHENTTSATVQSDIFDPPKSGGPSELTGCNGVTEGHTIWYDFFPDANGLVDIEATGIDTVIAVMPYDTTTLLPDNAARTCVVSTATDAQMLFAPVKAGLAYTIQIGGVGNEAGEVEVQFNYLVKLKLVMADTTLAARPKSNGVVLQSLSVTAPKAAKVLVRCTAGCHQVSRHGGGKVPGLSGSTLEAGASLEIFVTVKGEIGAFIRYKIVPHNFVKTQSCLVPGTMKPEACPS